MALAALLLVPAVADADGDPASDVLATRNLFLYADAGASTADQARLAAVVQAAAHDGYPIRVAVISSPSDLGSIAALWHQPHSYAQFLGQELSLVSNSRVLVAMPDGFGLYPAGRVGSAERAALASLRPAGSIRALPGAAVEAVLTLARSAGHPIPSSALGAAQSARPGARPGDMTRWVAFAAGIIMIVAAWSASLRARPLRLRPR